MDILRKYFNSTVYQAPDANPAAADPPPPPPPDPAASDVAALDPATGDAPPPPPPEAKPRRMVPEEVFVREVTPLRAKARELETTLEARDRTIREQNEMLQRLQQRPVGDQQPPAPQQQPSGDQNDFQSAVRREAQMMRLSDDTAAVRSAGLAKFPDFNESLNTLTALGVSSDIEFVQDVLAVDKENAHVLLDRLAKEPERALNLKNMDSRRRIAELTRMAPVSATPAPKSDPANSAPPSRVSRAPAPPPPVDPSASKVVDWRSDDASDADFDKGFHEMMSKRGARR